MVNKDGEEIANCLIFKRVNNHVQAVLNLLNDMACLQALPAFELNHCHPRAFPRQNCKIGCPSLSAE